MALVSTGYWGTVTVMDNGGQKSTLTYQLTAITALLAVAALATIRARLEAIIEGEVTAQSVQERFEEAAIVFPASGVEIQNKASLTVSIVGTAKLANLKVPTPDPAIFAGLIGGAANQIDINNAALLSYTSSFEAGQQALISDGEELDTLLNGKRIHAKSNLG